MSEQVYLSLTYGIGDTIYWLNNGSFYTPICTGVVSAIRIDSSEIMVTVISGRGEMEKEYEVRLKDVFADRGDAKRTAIAIFQAQIQKIKEW
jgi:hypothetical protein